jgi:DNA (cytosine-5)-methyltransferase 1
MKKFTFSDLFSGIGMNSVAFRQAGLEPVFASDIDPAAREVYQDNLGLAPAGDLALVDPGDVPDHDVCVASPPCQPYATPGERKGLQDGRSGTLYPLLRFVSHRRPRVVVVENVAPLATPGNPAFRLLRNMLRGLGYRLSWKVLKASDFGAGQTRERLFVVASLGRRFDFAALEPGTPGRIIDFLDPNVDEGWLGPDEYELLETPRIQQSGVAFAGYMHGSTRRKPDGDPALAWTHECWRQIHAAGGMGPTLTAHSNSRYLVLVGGRVRRVTLDECRRLMGLPDGFRLGGRGVEETMRLLGNGVFVPLVRRLAEEVVRQLLDGKAPVGPGRVRRQVALHREDDEPDEDTLRAWVETWRRASHATRLAMAGQPGRAGGDGTHQGSGGNERGAMSDNTRIYKVLSFFSGSMGLDLGLARTNRFEHLACVEKDPKRDFL